MTTVLVVDDDVDVRETLVELLEDRGFRVVAARDGVDALDRVLAVKPDVMLIDQRMPRMTGSDCVRALRSRGVDVPVVLMSAAHDVASLSQAAGIRWFLGKPFGLDELVGALTHALADTN
jgi:CheY-like chemotaxis protein